MTYRDLVNNLVTIEGDIRFVRYDWSKSENIWLTEEEAQDKDIKYIYPDPENPNGIVIEVRWEDDD